MPEHDERPILILVHGHRPTFPAQLVDDGARRMRAAAEAAAGERWRVVDLGVLGDLAAARAAAIAAQAHRRGPHQRGCLGIVLSMFNFSSENAVQAFVGLAELDVPILIHTEPDADGDGPLGSPARRDGACGRLSVCNALRHIGAPYTTTRRHVIGVYSDEFAGDLAAFLGTCAIADRFRRRGRGLRLGLVGGPPDEFQTMTAVSTELLGHIGLHATTLDLLALDRQMRDCPQETIDGERARISAYLPSGGMPERSLDSLARLGAVFNAFIADNDLDGLAVRCWTELQQYRIGGSCGISPCTCMSMLGDRLLPAACEVDIGGWMSMMMLQSACDLVPALADWNNMRAGPGEADDEIDLFHCGVWAKSLLRDGARITSHEILGPVEGIGHEHAWGTVDGDMISGHAAFLRLCTDARDGSIFTYAGEGEILPQPVRTFGTRGRLRVSGLQQLMRTLTDHGVEHHCAVVVGDQHRIATGLRAIEQAMPYLNHQAGLNRHGAELVTWHRHG